MTAKHGLRGHINMTIIRAMTTTAATPMTKTVKSLVNGVTDRSNDLYELNSNTIIITNVKQLSTENFCDSFYFV